MQQYGLLAGLIFLPLATWAEGLRHEAYAWQRAWTAPVEWAVADHGNAFANLVALKAEVTWHDGNPQVTRIPVKYGALAQIGRSVGLALRIGPFTGPFTDTNATYLSELARGLVDEARAGGLSLSELQVDFDCAASKLAGYRTWVVAMRKRIAPLPLVITALPSWLDQAAFKPLVQSADGFVLQVHSLERPASFDAPFTLCDPDAAKRAVEKAARLGVPFRVALPTYGYLMAFDKQGRFLGLSAEGPRKSWPVDARFREVRADPVELARLVRFWASNPPGAMTGIIWYRLPVAVDVLNWRWPTLSAILEMRIPRESVRAASRRVEPGLVEISLENDGELDISSRLAVQTRWQQARLVAGDGLRGFELADQGVSSARFQTSARPYRLPAGEKHVVGWIRLSVDREVQVELEKGAE